MDPLEKLKSLDPAKYGISASRRDATTPAGYTNSWIVNLHLLVRDRWIKLRRLTHEELAAVGLRPSNERGYAGGRSREKLGLGPREAAEEAARRISEATGIPVVED